MGPKTFPNVAGCFCSFCADFSVLADRSRPPSRLPVVERLKSGGFPIPHQAGQDLWSRLETKSDSRSDKEGGWVAFK